jgi:hypothetical protein
MTLCRRITDQLRSEGFCKIGEDRVMRVGTIRVYQKRRYRPGFDRPVPVEEAIVYPDGNFERYKVGA